jgi:hypothetical protein
MLYDSNGFKPYIYVLFFKTCPYVTHIYILLALRQNLLNINFRAVFKVFRTAGTIFTRHVRPMARTSPGIGFQLLARTCPGLGFQPIYIRGLSTSSNPNLTKPLSSLSCGGQGSLKVIWDLLHRIPSVSRGFDSPSPQDLQILSGSLSPKVFSRFSFDFYDLLLNFVNARSLYLGAPLGCHYFSLNLV